MSDVTEGALATFLSDRLDADVSVDDLHEHVEGWSRDTASFTARWEESGETHERRLVVRAESDAQVEGDATGEGNDVETEFRTMDAAQDAPVPVPETHWFEGDRSVLGGRFFVVDYVPGDAPVTWDRDQRQRLYDAWDERDGESSLPSQFVDCAVGVHTLGPGDVPELDDCPPEDVVERELDRWVGQYRDSVVRPEPAVEECIRWFRANAPEVPETTVVHGDFRIGNMLVDGDDVTALLDWELARIGDPMYDLGYASTYYFAGKLVDPIERPELACSLLDREWFYDEYERRSGRTVDRERVRYWRAFSAFVMMTIGLSGVDRFRSGETDDVRAAWFQYIVPGLVEDMLGVVREDRL
ncbi:phosphotransferase family protein [Halomarina litorea]|uniref:phosphotransferase family protein n=1 Tax=Halomarina litorea TaxID=2961595 RepID=UPI0020C52586|nr:phosphotransferase family protein [Halomarina sp. BCD28]